MAEEERLHSKSTQNNINGSLNGTTITAGDEVDLAATRQSIPNGSVAPLKRVHWCWDIFALGSVITFIADIGSDIFIAVLYFRNGEYSWFAFTIGFVVFSSFTLQIFSAKWFLDDARKEAWLTYLLHFLHVGPILRYWRAFRSGWKTRRKDVEPNEYKYFLEEWRDIYFLRLLEAYLESAPQLVLQLYILAYHRRVKTESDIRTAVTAAISLVSLSWSIVAYTGALRETFLNGISWAGLFFQILWRLFMMASRVTALVLFASFYRLWVFVAVGFHWLIMFIFLVMQDTTFCSSSDDSGSARATCTDGKTCKEICFNGIIAFVYNFSFFNISEGRTRTNALFFYAITFTEGSIFFALWYPHSSLFGNVSYAAVGLFFGGFVAGIFFMFIYYQFYHPKISKQGFCFKKKSYLHWYDLQCCCCDIYVLDHRETGQNESQNNKETQESKGKTKPPAGLAKSNSSRDLSTNSNLLYLDIMPRQSSREHIPHLVSPSEAYYMQNVGRVEVTMPSASLV